MLKLACRLNELNFSELMTVYAESNKENAEEFYHREAPSAAILRAEEDFYQYLSQVFFRTKGTLYAIWGEENGYVSALRLEPYRDGLLLEALETRPDCRRQGFARKLINEVLHWLQEQGNCTVYSHIHKRNYASLQTHLSCGFERVSEQAVYIDGSVTDRSCTMCFRIQN